jgi:hypothetical protein
VCKAYSNQPFSLELVLQRRELLLQVDFAKIVEPQHLLSLCLLFLLHLLFHFQLDLLWRRLLFAFHLLFDSASHFTLLLKLLLVQKPLSFGNLSLRSFKSLFLFGKLTLFTGKLSKLLITLLLTTELSCDVLKLLR